MSVQLAVTPPGFEKPEGTATVPWEAFDVTHPDHAWWCESQPCRANHDHAEWLAAREEEDVD